MDKEKFHVVSLSGGKDSTAMLLMMLEKKMPIDLILFCDTGVEFPAMYEHLEQLEKYIGMPITRIKSEKTFQYYLLEHEVRHRNDSQMSQIYGVNRKGYSWAGPRQRWCTSRLKTDIINSYMRNIGKQYDVIHYVGIAADESNRIRNLCYPLADWGITEKQALEYCYNKGFDFGGLYKIFDRVSCWCCPLQGLEELRMLRKYFPELWQQLRVWDKKTWRQFRADYSVEELEIRFAYEEECLKKGLSIKGRAFFIALKEHIGREVR